MYKLTVLSLPITTWTKRRIFAAMRRFFMQCQLRANIREEIDPRGRKLAIQNQLYSLRRIGLYPRVV